MKGQKILLRSICLLSAIIMLITTAGNVFAGSISDAQKEKEELESQLKEAQELIDTLSGSKEDIEENIYKLDEKLTEISIRITELETQLKDKELEITDTQEALQEAQADVDSQYESMKIRIRFMYENSTQSYLEVLLASESFGEFLNRAEYIYQISKYDRDMLEKYQETVELTGQIEEVLKTELAELEALKQQVEEEQQEVTQLLGAKEEQLAEIDGELTETQHLAQTYEAEIQAQNELIALIQQEEARKQAEKEARKKAEEEAKKQQEEKENGDQKNDEEKGEVQEPTEPTEPEEPAFGGVFTWPCSSSTRVTSDYGSRESPTSGASTYHRGIDIGADYGADIVSAADGEVSFVGYSNGGGNYITVSHGDGVYTVYMHCSSVVASAGQKVTAGQVIAKVGSTGISTGNHLHFGVSVNGSYVNPWDYLR